MLATKNFAEIDSEDDLTHDSATNALIRRYRRARSTVGHRPKAGR
ncbi:hypothetical protein OG225_12520 [Nocardia sp. NBC_01377]